ncbi:biotin-dependent carboxyltransferase family protein [Tundrisphaera sp. TA3]|uniref:5-oxoprolinase subunit C family protein n=1 Tax=Tundrisphaera sp. TA3 TaxID=3435775 RepID=UPI003EBE1690
MGLIVLQPGLATTVQDRGRVGYRSWGVPVGGAFDGTSSGLANALLGNHPDDATLEMTLVGGEYLAEGDMAFALAGAPMMVRVHPTAGHAWNLTVPQSFSLRRGDRLLVGGTPAGARAYLAVRGGWQTPLILGSRSAENRLEVGDRLDAAPGSTPVRRPSAWPWGVCRQASRPIRFVDGPDAGSVTSMAGALDGIEFTVSTRSDRMGLRLEGPPVVAAIGHDRPSMPVAPGAIQVAGGSPMILGVAGGTMGGYPHVAHVISADLDRLGQLRPGQAIRFIRVAVEEARRIDRSERSARRRWMTRLAASAGVMEQIRGFDSPT